MTTIATESKPAIPELATPHEKLIAELQRQIEIGHNMEASLRTELEAERAGTKRWGLRNERLEKRQKLIRLIANGAINDDVIAQLLGQHK